MCTSERMHIRKVHEHIRRVHATKPSDFLLKFEEKESIWCEEAEDMYEMWLGSTMKFWFHAAISGKWMTLERNLV